MHHSIYYILVILLLYSDCVFSLFELTRSDKIGAAILSYLHNIHILAIRSTVSRLTVFGISVAIIRCVPNDRLRRLTLESSEE